MRQQYRRKGLKNLCEQKFTRLCTITYVGSEDENKSKQWEMIQRTTRDIPFKDFETSPTPIPTDSVEICAILNKSSEKYLILVAQYRAPLDSVVLEFPAGLIDANETPTQATLRELYEETGYTAVENDIASISPPICIDCGISDSCCYFARVNIDGTHSSNLSPKQHLDEDEDIDVILVPIADPKKILQALNEIMEEKVTKYTRMIIDGKLYAFLEGISLPIF